MQENVKALKDLVAWAKRVPEQEIDWHIEQLEYFTNELFKYSKFKLRQKVKLVTVPQIDEKINHGWLAYRHILKPGAVATVVEVDHYKGRFRYDLVFKGEGGAFTFYEEYLAPYGRIK